MLIIRHIDIRPLRSRAPARPTTLALALFTLLACSQTSLRLSAAEPAFGPLYQEFQLTLAPGERREALGPLFYAEQKLSTRLWAVPPVFSYTLDEEIDYAEFDFLYPLLTYDRFGPDYRFHIGQLFSFAGGESLATGTNAHRFTLFPIYFQQRSADPDKNYTALFPIYGTLRNRLFRDEINFVLFPLYSRTIKRGGALPEVEFKSYRTRGLTVKTAGLRMVTRNYLYPIVHLREGDGLRGWQVWPLVGREKKVVTYKTNMWEEVELVSGYENFFALWPLYFRQNLGLGTENVQKHRALLPFFSYMRSPQRDSTTIPWPIGYTHTDDRAQRFKEWGAPWPLIVFARGEGKTTSRVFPFFSQAHNLTKEDNWYLWPIYKYNHTDSPPLDRRRRRVLFFLYSDLTERHTETGAKLHRVDCFPLWTFRRDLAGNQRLQLLSLLEPFLPGNKSIERDYSPLWALWRSEKNGTTGAASQSLLWNLYRRQTTAESKKCSLLFGLFQYQSNAEGNRWRVFFVPMGKARKEASASPSAP